jgi:hypothetical protein
MKERSFHLYQSDPSRLLHRLHQLHQLHPQRLSGL